jgi:hypothetical protein
MKAIDNSAAQGYCTPKNQLSAAVAFSYSGGTGYTSAPTVSFSGGGGTGAAATATVTNGRVTGITITNAGSGYTSAPTVAFSGGGGHGAAATATVGSGAVTAVTVTNYGTDRILTVTDNTSYPGSDSRAALQVTVADKFGKKKEYKTGSSPAYITADVVGDGLNPTDGLDVLVTVVSAAGLNKNGSVYDVATLKQSGSVTMDI